MLPLHADLCRFTTREEVKPWIIASVPRRSTTHGAGFGRVPRLPIRLPTVSLSIVAQLLRAVVRRHRRDYRWDSVSVEFLIV